MSYKPNKQTQEALLNGATALIEPIDEWNIHVYDSTNEVLCSEVSLLQVGDEFYCQEVSHRMAYSQQVLYGKLESYDDFTYEVPASEMQEHQSRFKGIVVSVEVKRVQGLWDRDWIKMGLSLHTNPISYHISYQPKSLTSFSFYSIIIVY